MTEDDEKTEHFDDEDAPIRCTRRREKKNEPENDKDEGHSGWVRRSSRQSKPASLSSSHAPEADACSSDGTHQSAENGVRRSKRQHHKPTFYDPEDYEKHQTSSEDEDEDDDEEEEEEEEADEEKGKLQ